MDPGLETPSLSLPPRRRKFHIKSKFGEPRQWRSRKSRPCDACRQRKTACVIDTQPPCFYCYRKGIDCQATDTVPTPATLATRKTPTPSSESNQDTVSDGDNAGLAYTTPGPQPLPLPLPSPISVLLDAAVICASAPNDSTPPFVAPSETTPITAISPALTSTSLPDVSSPDPPQSISGCFSAIAHGAAIYTLDDNDGLTAHCMGLSGEQDTELLASFRAAVMNEVDSVDADILQVYPGGNIGIEGSQPPVHFNMIRDEFMPLDNAAKKASSDRIEAIVQGCDDHLVRVYFRHVHPVYPVLSKTRFLQAYAADRQSIPASLRGAVYGIASNFWHRDQIQTLGPATMTTTTATGTATATSPLPCAATMFHLDQHELFEQALASLQRELHGPNLWTLQACLLLIHENSADNATIETPRVWMLASQAVACAQVIGLHRDPMAWQLAAWEKHLRRKLWWATFAIDVWSSVCHGNPPHIYQGSFTTSPPAMEDMALGEDVPDSLRYMIDEDSASSDTAVCARFLNTISVSCIVHKLLLSSFSDVAYVESMKDPLSREAPLLQTRRQLQDWSLLLPRCISMESTPAAGVHQHNNAPLHLSYYAAVALNFRALMSPVTKAAKQDPGSSLRRHFPLAIKDFGSFIDFMLGISPDCLHAFWGLHARSQFILCGNFLIYLFLLAPTPDQVQDTFAQLGKFHDSLQRLSAVADKFTIGVLRPVALRIDSFFTQAAQIMRTNGQSPAG